MLLVQGHTSTSKTEMRECISMILDMVVIDNAKLAPSELIGKMEEAFKLSHKINQLFGNTSIIFITDFNELVSVIWSQSLAAQPPIHNDNQNHYNPRPQPPRLFSANFTTSCLPRHRKDRTNIIFSDTASELSETPDSPTNGYSGSFTWCQDIPFIYTSNSLRRNWGLTIGTAVFADCLILHPGKRPLPTAPRFGCSLNHLPISLGRDPLSLETINANLK
ncbi:hypothetical protein SYNPS1DRAFT_27607 [Syncephalis pseudoplumigaleata]|uniref:Uncharacterized protein n=1 Tax=Syncephalis pseudoplumigaleata TaxID=1712513 RepID=A0A4P9Z2X1_9FUNG|nr:hypothetical protein SYNPS1DRAFT_27607 [Syncephalis pseudoplumigaleata]|eukprot:RKP26718.1 hypothetical protein SYNPS1DRAFT_27607 [Syncephalis pseudoplumigaleata]